VVTEAEGKAIQVSIDSGQLVLVTEENKDFMRAKPEMQDYFKHLDKQQAIKDLEALNVTDESKRTAN
jgi:hypothetical protein